VLHEQLHIPAKTLLSTKVLLHKDAGLTQVLRHICQSCLIALNTPRTSPMESDPEVQASTALFGRSQNPLMKNTLKTLREYFSG